MIVHTEDAAGYRKPVTFWNGQLFPLIGCGSESSLKRIRRRCIEAGWLQYTAGWKGHAAAYFVTIPTHLEGIDDGVTAEQENEYSDDDSSPVVTGKPSRIRCRSDLESVQNPSRKRPASGRHPAYIPPVTSPVSYPDQIQIPPNPPPGGLPEVAPTSPETKTGGHPGTNGKAAAALPALPAGPPPKVVALMEAVAEVCGVTLATAGSGIRTIAETLAADAPPWTPDDCHAFRERFHELCPKAKREGRHRPYPNELKHNIGLLRSQPGGSSAESEQRKADTRKMLDSLPVIDEAEQAKVRDIIAKRKAKLAEPVFGSTPVEVP